jgi:DNA sulfur modification protein DndD
MIIEKIELENFMCYAGNNCIEFTEGINVIIGDNGYGKSKLYDAFYWVMYDQVFVPEKKEFQNTKTVKSKIISDKAKYNAQDGRLSTAVSITFHNLDNDRIYILERKYTVNINDGKIIESNDSEFTVMQKELSYLNAKMINDEEEKRKIVARILPSQIKDYLWFQGEQVESIIDFNKQDTLTKAINVLSSITRYDELKDIAVSAAKSANNEYDREVKRLSKDTGRSEQLGSEKSQLEQKIENLLLDEEEVNENLSRAEAKCDDLLGKQADAIKVRELQEKKKGVMNLLNELNETLKEEQISFHRKMFRNKWVLKGTENLQEEYGKRFSVYEQKKLTMIAEREAKLSLENETSEKLQTRLPFNVPEPNYIQWMLDKERCLVCDREAKKDSEAWGKIKELIDRPNKKLKSEDDEPLALQNFTEDLKRLYTNGLSLSSRITDIDDEIKERLEKRNSINTKVRDANKSLQRIEEDIQKLLADTSLNIESAGHILDEYSIQNKYVKDYTEQRIKLSQQIEHSKSNLKNVNDQLKALVTGEIPKWLEEKKTILNDFETIARTTRERVFNNLIALLEKEANTHYEAMTSGNKSARGQIKLRKLPNGNYMPEIIDNHGVPLLGSNTSNLILVKLAAIMAIISAKNSSGVVNLYTLITDAPTSVFGEDYTIGFCRTVSKVYKQSIIMSKEFYKNQNLRNELLTNSEIKIGKVYTITPSIPENERNNRNNLSTKIEALN